MVTRVHQADRQLTVVGHQDQAPAVEVEAPHREEPTAGVRDLLQDGSAATVISNRGQHPDRLVQHPVFERRSADFAAVDRDPVLARADQLSDHRRQAVDRDPSGADQRVGLAPGGNPRAGDESI